MVIHRVYREFAHRRKVGARLASVALLVYQDILDTIIGFTDSWYFRQRSGAPT
jgi:hypothetical protein